MQFTFWVNPRMDTGSADILSACGLEARVPIKPWLELSFLGLYKCTGHALWLAFAAKPASVPPSHSSLTLPLAYLMNQ